MRDLPHGGVGRLLLGMGAEVPCSPSSVLSVIVPCVLVLSFVTLSQEVLPSLCACWFLCCWFQTTRIAGGPKNTQVIDNSSAWRYDEAWADCC